jgi:hypothetical protein
MDATAILDYFAPLKKWLDEQNAGEKQGWDGMDGAVIKMNKMNKMEK